MHRHGFADYQTIGDEFTDCLARVGVGNFVDFVGVEPDLAFAAAGHGGGKTLLSAEIDPVRGIGGLARVMLIEGCVSGVM